MLLVCQCNDNIRSRTNFNWNNFRDIRASSSSTKCFWKFRGDLCDVEKKKTKKEIKLSYNFCSCSWFYKWINWYSGQFVYGETLTCWRHSHSFVHDLLCMILGPHWRSTQYEALFVSLFISIRDICSFNIVTGDTFLRPIYRNMPSLVLSQKDRREVRKAVDCILLVSRINCIFVSLENFYLACNNLSSLILDLHSDGTVEFTKTNVTLGSCWTSII